MMSRCCYVILFTLLLLLTVTEFSCAEPPDFVRPIQQLNGENYRYAIDFLFFTRLAEGELRFSETETLGVYRAELIGRTLGIASWLAGDRTQTYRSTMELMADGSLRSIEYSAEIDKRRWGKLQSKASHLRFDYAKRQVIDEKSREGEVTSTKVSDIPEAQQPVDMLAAFYNLRSGVYGPLVRGAILAIPTYAKGRFTEIEVHVLTVEQQAKHRYFPADGQLFLAKVDPEIFETDGENLYFWLNNAGILERGIIEDMIGLGDVKGRLEGEKQ